MWAVAAQPRTGLTPMIPTPSVASGIARTPARGDRRSEGVSIALDGDIHWFASSSFAGQCLHGVGKTRPDLLVGQLAFVEAGVRMGDWELEIQYPRAERRQHLPQLGLCPGRAERAGAR